MSCMHPYLGPTNVILRQMLADYAVDCYPVHSVIACNHGSPGSYVHCVEMV